MSAIMAHAKQLKLGVERVVHNKHHIEETEVSQSTVTNTNIEQLLLDIERCESLLLTDPDLDTLRTLIALYQKV
jgi:hypothetical protein